MAGKKEVEERWGMGSSSPLSVMRTDLRGSGRGAKRMRRGAGGARERCWRMLGECIGRQAAVAMGDPGQRGRLNQHKSPGPRSITRCPPGAPDRISRCPGARALSRAHPSSSSCSPGPSVSVQHTHVLMVLATVRAAPASTWARGSDTACPPSASSPDPA
jgi:hypothetical protein